MPIVRRYRIPCVYTRCTLNVDPQVSHAMIIKRVINQFRAQDWTALLSELVIVVVGIFIAIQADRWWEQQDDLRQEQVYITRLTEDIERDVDEITYSIALATFRRDFADLLIAASENPELARNEPERFLAAVQQAAFTATAALTSDTFAELRSTGNLGLLRDKDLKTALFEYYRFDEQARQYQSLQLMTEIRHLEFAAKILDHGQRVWVQDNYYVYGPRHAADVKYPESELQGVVDAAIRLQNSPDFVAWLPEARGLQLELIQTHEGRLRGAEALLVILRGSLKGASDL